MTGRPLEDDLIAQIAGGTLDETREIAEFVNLPSQMHAHYGRGFQGFDMIPPK